MDNKCLICGKPIPYDRVYCTTNCVGDSYMNKDKYPKQRKEYMISYYMRLEEMGFVEKLL